MKNLLQKDHKRVSIFLGKIKWDKTLKIYERFINLRFVCYVAALLVLLCLPAVGAAQHDTNSSPTTVNIRLKVFLEGLLIENSHITSSIAILSVGESFHDCASCPEMVIVPAGKFTMGSPEGEEDRDSREQQHEVTIPKAFAVGKYEVTRGQFAEAAASTSTIGFRWAGTSFEQTDAHPVVSVNWHEAKAYVQWLSIETGQNYRLLSEAEWEYVARAGTTTRYHFGNTINSSLARYRHEGCDPDRSACIGTVAVGSYPSNAFGLHDVHGNAWELVEDCWHRTYDGAPTDGSAWTENCLFGTHDGGHGGISVIRGGGWSSALSGLRSAFRTLDVPFLRISSNGFRIARDLSP